MSDPLYSDPELESEWSYLGLPLPNRNAYSYTKSLRLFRSPMESPLPEQAQLANPGKKTFKISWNLTPEQLNTATLYLLEHGYDWFQIELVSEEGFTLHEVRLTDKFDTVPINGVYYKLTAVVETRIDPISCTPVITCDILNIDELYPCGTPPNITIADNFTTQGSVPEGNILTNVTIISSGLYPIEADESMTSRGLLDHGYLFANQLEHYILGYTPLTGTIVDVYNDVFHTQYPEDFIQIYNFTPLTGLIIGKEGLVLPESITSSALITEGTIIIVNQINIVPEPEEFTSRALIISGDLT